MSNSKKILVGVVILVIVAGAAVILAMNKPESAQNNAINNQNVEKKPNLSVSMADVVSVSGQKITAKSGETQMILNVGPNTKLVKQVKEGTGVKLVEAKISDFKKGSLIVISPEVKTQEVTPEKIQIIN